MEEILLQEQSNFFNEGMLKKQLDSVKKFHETYKLGYSISPQANLGNKKNTYIISLSSLLFALFGIYSLSKNTQLFYLGNNALIIPSSFKIKINDVIIKDNVINLVKKYSKALNKKK